ncbi:hypothetical protein PAHAL_2G272800 [Panicum hallii]|uniref:Uncharacterized protein n=1 Tax=Panicum hallii TaxID=206008 RepID=A0A2T8KQI5_9POAL|nr:hypothetical protein PAHAL_2G272800 [Panicum hallii]
MMAKGRDNFSVFFRTTSLQSAIEYPILWPGPTQRTSARGHTGMVPSLLRAEPSRQAGSPIPPHTPTRTQKNHRQIFRSYLSPLRRSREAVTAAARAGPAESITA